MSESKQLLCFPRLFPELRQCKIHSWCVGSILSLLSVVLVCNLEHSRGSCGVTP